MLFLFFHNGDSTSDVSYYIALLTNSKTAASTNFPVLTPTCRTVWNPVATSYVFSTIGADLPPPSALPGPSGTSTTIVPTDIPDFASAACDGNTTPIPVRYSSACSCAKISQATSVAPSPTTTVDYTSTATVSTFLLLATGGPLAEPQFLNFSLYAFTDIIGFTPDITGAASFALSGTQLELVANGFLSEQDSIPSEPLFFSSSSLISSDGSGGFDVVSVSIDQDLGVSLRNDVIGNSVIQACGKYLDVTATEGGTDVIGDTCEPISVKAVPL